MSWRLAESLQTLREQVNAAYPNRSKLSDGTIGDAAHASRASDHNPWVKDGGRGVVTALDITHDPANGLDIQALANAIVASKDERVKYIICNGRICSGTGQAHQAWTWRNYTGANKHTKHVHISVKSEKRFYDAATAWALPKGKASAPAPVAPKDSVLKKGSKGELVKELQISLNTLGYGPLAPDGVFGAKTEETVKAFQKAQGLVSDGWAGPRTLEKIGQLLGEATAAPKIAKAEQQVPSTAVEAVEKKSGLWQLITGGLGGSGVAVTTAFGMDWRLALAIGGITLVLLLVLLIFRKQVVAAFRDINAELR